MVKLSDLLVVDLRRELERRGLDKTGLKQVLVDRLRQAMAMDGVNTDTIAIDEHRARKIRAHSRILRLEREVLRPENLVQSQLCA